MARDISDKVKEKWRKEDLELHKRIITSYLHQCGLKLRARNKFFILYDMVIDHTNLYDYFHIPVHILVEALVLDQLDKVMSYIDTPKPRKPNKKKRKCQNQ